MTPPERIWLQWHGDAEEWEDGPVSEGDVTWSPDRMFRGDVEYVRVEP